MKKLIVSIDYYTKFTLTYYVVVRIIEQILNQYTYGIRLQYFIFDLFIALLNFISCSSHSGIFYVTIIFGLCGSRQPAVEITQREGANF